MAFRQEIDAIGNSESEVRVLSSVSWYKETRCFQLSDGIRRHRTRKSGKAGQVRYWVRSRPTGRLVARDKLPAIKVSSLSKIARVEPPSHIANIGPVPLSQSRIPGKTAFPYCQYRPCPAFPVPLSRPCPAFFRFLGRPAFVLGHAKIPLMTCPCTSVSRKSRPAWWKVSFSWSKPRSWRIVAWRSCTCTGFSAMWKPRSSVAP
jgi:hypothetical protein